MMLLKVWENSDLKRIRSAGRAIQANRKRGTIPPERLTELLLVLKTHYDVEDVTDLMVDEAADINCLEVIAIAPSVLRMTFSTR